MFVTVGMLSVGELALDERHLCVDTVRPVDLLRRPVIDPGGTSDLDAIGAALLRWRVGEQCLVLSREDVRRESYRSEMSFVTTRTPSSLSSSRRIDFGPVIVAYPAPEYYHTRRLTTQRILTDVFSRPSNASNEFDTVGVVIVRTDISRSASHLEGVAIAVRSERRDRDGILAIEGQ
ncbi:hypothetical protein Htur_4891 (plasmid) [Haloterrigena turkmenica DSM 5511]|uniref:Uncharacterized protein n=2 Tax=Haloterrigena turkmenica TaxID=62320 RepID=D2S2P0_HALTV|nr:hypothetical protein Htur_4891 [Haloterrigena turkmenica DSM 5511]